MGGGVGCQAARLLRLALLSLLGLSAALRIRGGAVAAMAASSLLFQRIPLAQLDAARRIEKASYPADEAASREKLQMRLTEAGEYFWGAYTSAGTGASELCGFVCGTLSGEELLTEESMSEHDPQGHTLCIHSVVVEQSKRRNGVGAWMLREYLRTVTKAGWVRKVALLCKEPLVGFYASAGFELLGPSDVVHGQDTWMLMTLTPTADNSVTEE